MAAGAALQAAEQQVRSTQLMLEDTLYVLQDRFTELANMESERNEKEAQLRAEREALADERCV